MAKISIFDKKKSYTTLQTSLWEPLFREISEILQWFKMFVALEIIWTEQELQQSNGRSLPLFYTCPASKFQLDFFEF